jgi:hypothetical protein
MEMLLAVVMLLEDAAFTKQLYTRGLSNFMQLQGGSSP